MSSRFCPSAYPPHWPALRHAVFVRAAYACECQGECGSGHGPMGRCHAPQYAHVVREPGAPGRWWAVAPDRPPVLGPVIRIVLAAARQCQDSTCADLACLLAYCQRCHLRYDHAQQWRTRRRKQRAALEAAGQLRLWPAEGWGEALPPRPPGLPTRPALPWGEGAPGVPDNTACVNIQRRARHPDPSSPSGGQEINHILARRLVACVAFLPPV